MIIVEDFTLRQILIYSVSQAIQPFLTQAGQSVLNFKVPFLKEIVHIAAIV